MSIAMEMTSPNSLVSFLKQIHSRAGLIARVKIAYRPYICPFSELLALVSAGDRVFDVGAGSGQFCLLLAEFAHAGWVGGIEIRESLVRNARELFANAKVKVPHRFETYDGMTFPRHIRDADKVFVVDILHHLPSRKQAQFLSGLHKAMADGSILILKDIDGASPFAFFNKVHDLFLAGEIGSEVSALRSREMAREAGFKVRSDSYKRMWWYPHYTLVLEK